MPNVIIIMTMKRKFFHCLSMTCLLILNFKLLLLFDHDQIVWANPMLVNDDNNNNNNNNSNQTIQVQLFKNNDRPIRSMNDNNGRNRPNKEEETTTILPYFFRHPQSSSLSSINITNNSTYYQSNSDSTNDNGNKHSSQPRTDLYTIELTSPSITQQHHHSRQAKLDDDNIVFNYKCPKQHFIHPCDCLELDKRAEMYDDGSGGGGDGDDDITVNGTPTFEMIEEDPIHPDLIETVVLCKNIRNAQVLTEAIRGFQGHRVNYMVLDGCKLPPFPNNLFKGIHIVWMEILNSTMQFHDNFFQNLRHCP
ncbi:hypothetical protein DERP_011278 [Dermatophagoides pteronyssinus]|uniref:Uncharacterized protein n=3 Tax=Dermatophagoides pteronyssinus TaxID=6956 RepID=A0ABQ8J769_DERPT|nr:hypothetical protein DERP_011278 [Dermatophagoides pteronyssinus]